MLFFQYYQPQGVSSFYYDVLKNYLKRIREEDLGGNQYAIAKLKILSNML